MSDPKGRLVDIGHTHASLLERDVRVADLAPTMRAAAMRLVQAGDASAKARWELALAREVKEHGGRVLAEELRLAELDTRLAAKADRDTLMYRSFFPAGIGGFDRGRLEARLRRLRTLVESMASQASTEARGASLGVALKSFEEAVAALGEARRRRDVAVRGQAQAREAFVNQYRLGLAAVITRLGDRQAASEFFPTLASSSTPEGRLATPPDANAAAPVQSDTAAPTPAA